MQTHGGVDQPGVGGILSSSEWLKSEVGTGGGRLCVSPVGVGPRRTDVCPVGGGSHARTGGYSEHVAGGGRHG